MKRTLVIGALMVSACSKKEPAEELAPPPSSTAAPRPVEHLASDELVEGKEKAFGLILPRDLTIKKRYDDLVYTSANAKGEPLAKYFQAHVSEGTVRNDFSGTTFDNVRVPGEPQTLLRIRITSNPEGLGSLVEIRNVTPPPTPDLPDETARWKAAGLNPNGQVLDPKHLH